MARIRIPDGEGAERSRMWQLRPELGSAAAHLASAVYEQSVLPHRVREAVRYRLARVNDCPT